jgi:hypothetical protein
MKNLIAILLLTATAFAGDVTGKWSGSFKVEGGDHDIPQVFTLKQQGKTVTGSGGPEADEQYPIETGTVEGASVQFELTSGDWKFEYDLKQSDADHLQGGLKLTKLNETRHAKVSLARVK